MNHKFHIAMLTAVALMASSVAVAQSAVGLDRSLARVEQSRDGRPLWAASAADPLSAITGYLGNRGLSDAALASLEVTGTHAGDGDVTQVRMEQRVDGVAIYGAYVKAALNAQGELIHLIDHTYDVTFASSSRIDELQALKAVMAHLYPSEKALFVVADVRGNSMLFDGGAFFQGKPSVTAVLLPMEDGSLAGGWLVQTWTRKSNDLHHTVVDGEGRILDVESRTANDSYKVFVEDPLKAAQTTVNGPGNGNAQSPAGWLSGSQTTINITGNNTHTYLDADANNAADSGGTAVSNGDFVTAVDLAAQPSTTANKAVAVQNLFYLNNIAHDVLYRHGFNEAAGNFQTNNFGNGGAGNDAVNAEAQDGSGTDNANFSTPSDGSAPRMQMYLWSGNTPNGLVTTAGATDYGAYGSTFGAALTSTGVTGTLAVYNDATAPASDGCEAVSAGSLTGKVVIVDRGLCNFTVKVKNAQNAGAVAVLIANNDASGAFAPGGTDRKVKIPSAMVSQAHGVTLKGLSGSAGTLRKNPATPLKIDGDLDSDIVFHEYGHGLTWRMIGSMSGPLAGAIGEGASDVNAFLINCGSGTGECDDVVGEYAYANTLGIRRYPYKNYPLTYKDVTGAGVHNDGEIYAGAMWKVLENYKAAGLTADQLLHDFVQGMDYTPAKPAFENMRDGMLSSVAASTLYQAAERKARQCAIWNGFASSGIGVGAKGTVSVRGTVSITESFAIPSTLSCP